MSTARRQDIACRELVEILTEFLEGALDEQTRTWVEHCPCSCSGWIISTVGQLQD